MNQHVKISVLDHVHNAERRYYVALHQYAQAAKTGDPVKVEQFRLALCDAFEELRQAHEKLALGCEE